MSDYNKGSEWRQWDLHVHTPASFHWKGEKFNDDWEHDADLIDKMVEAMNKAEPAVFALMDYWTFEGWFKLKKRQAEVGAVKLTKKVFPGIELRLVAPTTVRLNAHVLFSDKIIDQDLKDFKLCLEVGIVKKPLSESSLIELARNVGEDRLRGQGHAKHTVDTDEKEALFAGSKIAEVTCESYKDAIKKVPQGQAVGFMPYDTSDGLAEVKWQEHYTYFLDLFESSPIFESRKQHLRDAFVGKETQDNARWFSDFQNGLKNIARLVVSGSDAHQFTGVKGNNDKRGYGDYPSGKITWIKAAPTFLGLKQAIKEPRKRSFIGEMPRKIKEVAENKTYFISSICINKNPKSSLTDENWLDKCNLPLNSDLVAIIGNKGSGKSALADVIALLGNCKNIDKFSFLSQKRFRSPQASLASHFTGRLKWADDSENTKLLMDDPAKEAPELIRYIPQSYFEELCNEHAEGRSDVFEDELKAVIFAHIEPEIRNGAFNFSQLVESQEDGFRTQLNEFRKDLYQTNSKIEGIESQLQPEKRKEIDELVVLKRKQIEEHNKIKPKNVKEPEESTTPKQVEAVRVIKEAASKVQVIEKEIELLLQEKSKINAKIRAGKAVRERVQIFTRQYEQFKDGIELDIKTLGLDLGKIISVKIDEGSITTLASSIGKDLKTTQESLEQKNKEKEKLLKKQEVFKKQLDEPQQIYQKYLKELKSWNEAFEKLEGTVNAPDSLKGLEERLNQLKQLPEKLTEMKSQRLVLTKEIFKVLDIQRCSREELFSPVQELIQKNKLIREEYKLQFRSTLAVSVESFVSKLFELVKQNTGEFRGEEESFRTIKGIIDKYDLNDSDDTVSCIKEIDEKINKAAQNNSKNTVGISSVLRKNKRPSDVYNMLFGLSFLEPKYTLLFQDTQIEQLSPGQRGALLLIFYLLVDKERLPIVLDQPEENLDNETVVSLLVPVLTQAKKHRQIIMVTHNPNLAVVCDAEQIVYSSFDRKNAAEIKYISGSIENPEINRHVVNVLEGTMPAFNNRRIKYHK